MKKIISIKSELQLKKNDNYTSIDELITEELNLQKEYKSI